MDGYRNKRKRLIVSIERADTGGVQNDFLDFEYGDQQQPIASMNATAEAQRGSPVENLDRLLHRWHSIHSVLDPRLRLTSCKNLLAKLRKSAANLAATPTTAMPSLDELTIHLFLSVADEMLCIYVDVKHKLDKAANVYQTAIMPLTAQAIRHKVTANLWISSTITFLAANSPASLSGIATEVMPLVSRFIALDSLVQQCVNTVQVSMCIETVQANPFNPHVPSLFKEAYAIMERLHSCASPSQYLMDLNTQLSICELEFSLLSPLTITPATSRLELLKADCWQVRGMFITTPYIQLEFLLAQLFFRWSREAVELQQAELTQFCEELCTILSQKHTDRSSHSVVLHDLYFELAMRKRDAAMYHRALECLRLEPLRQSEFDADPSLLPLRHATHLELQLYRDLAAWRWELAMTPNVETIMCRRVLLSSVSASVHLFTAKPMCICWATLPGWRYKLHSVVNDMLYALATLPDKRLYEQLEQLVCVPSDDGQARHAQPHGDRVRASRVAAALMGAFARHQL